jgi:UDP-N-acetylmuramoyl-tripeptide--D-alanyl-D-alanine ligase
LKLQAAIEFMQATASELDPALRERETNSFSIDSRDVQAGDVFFALSQPDYKNNGFNGDFDDATVFVPAAFEKGAIACAVRPDRYEADRTKLEQFRHQLLFVDDVIAAFQKLAHGVYLEWGGPVVAITGSAGKTTAKEITAHVLEKSGRKVLRNIKNYNNGLGHPITVLNLAKDMSYDVAVLEMGMSTPMNEIRRLCNITPPDVAVELNVLPVHVEHLGSIENVAKAKAELVEGLKEGGTAVLNADDLRVLAMRDLVSNAFVLTYGTDTAADIRAIDVRFKRFGETTFELATPTGNSNVTFALNGRHNISNALAAAAVGHIFGMNVRDIASALGSVAAPPQRGEVLHFASGFTVINDSYNSNPSALLSMIETVIEGRPQGARVVVVAGEMLELGEKEKQIHQDVGEQVAAAGVDVLVGVRGLARQMTDAAERAGLDSVHFSEDSENAGDHLANIIRAGDVVLIKGSRGVRTEKVLEKLLEKFQLENSASGKAVK